MENYSFKNNILLINDTEITGYDEGDDVIQAERLNDSALHKIGADGEMVVSLSADRFRPYNISSYAIWIR